MKKGSRKLKEISITPKPSFKSGNVSQSKQPRKKRVQFKVGVKKSNYV